MRDLTHRARPLLMELAISEESPVAERRYRDGDSARRRSSLAEGSRFSAGRGGQRRWAVVTRLAPRLAGAQTQGPSAITERYPGYVHHQIVELGYLKSAHSVGTDSVAFNVQPRKTGQILIGSSRQYAAEGTEINTPFLNRMLQRALEYMPGIGQLGRHSLLDRATGQPRRISSP